MGSVTASKDLTPEGRRELLEALINTGLRHGGLLKTGLQSHYRVAIAIGVAARSAMHSISSSGNEDVDAEAMLGAITDVIKSDFRWERDDPGSVVKQIRSAMAALRWLCCGLARIHINSHTYAKALLCSDAPAEPFHLPFESFELLLPSDLIPKIHRIFVEAADEDDVTVSGIRMSSFNADGMCMNSGTVRFDIMNGEILDSMGYDRQVQAAIFAIRGACLAMAAGDHGAKKIGKGHTQPADAVLDVLGQPIVRTWQLGRPVKIDCGPALYEWLNGKGGGHGPRKVRWLRRGHWTHQVCGAGRAERRLKWIEPHWCGREGAPVLVRPHVLGPKSL